MSLRGFHRFQPCPLPCRRRPWFGRLHVALSSVCEGSGHDSNCTTEDQGFSDVSLVEHYCSVDCGIPDSFPPDLTPEWTPLKTLRVKKSGGIVPEYRAARSRIHLYWLWAWPPIRFLGYLCSPHNSCNSATEWIQSTGAVVRLGLYANTPFIIPGDNSRIVMKYA